MSTLCICSFFIWFSICTCFAECNTQLLPYSLHSTCRVRMELLVSLMPCSSVLFGVWSLEKKAIYSRKCRCTKGAFLLSNYMISLSNPDSVFLLIILFFHDTATSSLWYLFNVYQYLFIRFDASNRGALSLEDFLDGWAKISMESGGSTILKRVRALAAEGFNRDSRESRKH